MHYGKFEQMPVMHWGCWPETQERWYKEGVPKDVDYYRFYKYFNATRLHEKVAPNEVVELSPAFEEETIKETDEYRIFRQNDGVIAQHWRNKSCIPHFIDFTLKDEKGWPEYKKRLQPRPERIPSDIDTHIDKALSSDAPVCVYTGSLIGIIRNWMGIENFAYLCYDNRDLLKEMVDTMVNLVCWSLDQILPKVKVDLGWGWEDICFRNGPLISPNIFKECLVPGYQKISSKLREYGVNLYAVDSDGLIDDLLPLWLEGGVNIMFPLEIGVWEADPYALRKKYGKELRIYGGIDKREIAKGPKAIDAEIEKHLPLMKEGGFVPLPDHLIPPDTSLANYEYYLEKIRKLRF